MDRLTFESDTEPYAQERDAEVFKVSRMAFILRGAYMLKQLAQTHDVECKSLVSHTLFDPEAILAKNKGRSTTSYNSFGAL